MKTIWYSSDAQNDLRKQRSQAKRLIAKIERYAATGAGDVKQLVGSEDKRLRIGNFRAIFEETEREIVVLRIRPRGEIYD